MTKITIHHATVARASRLGFDLIAIPGETTTFRAIRHADNAESVGTHNSAKDLVQSLMEGTVEFVEAPTFGGLRSGVMVMTYHIRYTQNGGGCGDTLDQALRDLLVSEEGTNLDLLRAIAENHGVWTGKWAGLNPGMQRMNLANRLRALLRNDANAIIDLGDEGKGRFDIAYEPSRKSLRAIARRNAAQAQG